MPINQHYIYIFPLDEVELGSCKLKQLRKEAATSYKAEEIHTNEYIPFVPQTSQGFKSCYLHFIKVSMPMLFHIFPRTHV